VRLSDEELEQYEIAFHLKISMQQLMEMEYDEYLGWQDYFKRRPVGWREDSRTSMMLRALGSKINPEAVFPSLKALSEGAEYNENERLAKSLKRSFFFQQMLTAKGGDKLEFLKGE
jgi:hypothetical protein